MGFERKITKEGNLIQKYDACIVGTGTMGNALLTRFRTVGFDGALATLGRTSKQYEETILSSEVLLLCMKQKDVCDWISRFGGHLHQDQIVVSLAAALDLDTLKSYSANNQLKIARMMTTTGVKEGNSAVIWTANEDCTDTDLLKVKGLVSRLGEAKYVGLNQDAMIDRETHKACDPGRIAFMLSCYCDELRHLGYSTEEARTSVLKALQLIIEKTDQGVTFADIVQEVASRGGITEASNDAMRESLQIAFTNGMQAAIRRMQKIKAMYRKGA